MIKSKKDKLIEVYQDTLKKSESLNSVPNTKKYDFSVIVPALPEGPDNFYNVWNMDTVSAIKVLKSSGKTCVLNMASYKKPGGGVRNGSVAQEECLFRCSNLGIEDTFSFYPLKDTEALYTENATFFKKFDYSHMEPITVDVVTIAAFNFNKREEKRPAYEDYESETKQKIRLMLSLAIINRCNNFILGSWGCGVFKNDPTKMATMFREILDEGFGYNFKKIVFAIINDHNSDHNNYSIFKSIIE